MNFDQIAKHQRGGHGSPCLFTSDQDAERALWQSVLIKPGLRMIRLSDGRTAVFRSASKKEGTVGFDSWHGGWEATHTELREVGRIDVPTFQN